MKMANYKMCVLPLSLKDETYVNGYDYQFAEYNLKNVNLNIFLDKDLPWYKRFIDVLPLKDVVSISFGEGGTPLIKADRLGKNIYVKNEGGNPSGCYKDREAALIMAFYDQMKPHCHKFCIISSGNAAVAFSNYASQYKKEMLCIIPKGTSESKKNLILMNGGKIKEIDGDYEDCHHYVLNNINEFSDYINVSAGFESLRDQGNKIIAYEIFDVLGDECKCVLIPTANGALLSGIYQGFKELMQLNLITKLPKLIAVQVKDADPIKKAIDHKKSIFVINGALPDSLAEGLVASESFCSPKAIHAINETNGGVILVDDNDVLQGWSIAKNKVGLTVELTSASVFVAIEKLYSEKMVEKTDNIIVINSATGVKDWEMLIGCFLKG